jgi:hypothetical protein
VLSKIGKVPDEVRAIIENTKMDGTAIPGSFFGEISAKAMSVWPVMHSTP